VFLGQISDLTLSGAAAHREPANLSPMKRAIATSIFHSDLTPAEQTPPEWIELFPAGTGSDHRIDARDGRHWFANPAGVIVAFAANNGPLPIDYEHGQDVLADKGQAAPAAGWIIKVEDRSGAVWGQVEWTAAATRMIVEREYRFISPAFNHTKDLKITRLLGAALVNRPAMQMTALSREQQQQETDMKAIAKALGLPETADEAAILAALAARDTERTAICSALKIEGDKPAHDAVLAAITKLHEDHATALASAKKTDDTEVSALRKSLDDTTKSLAALQKKDADREIDTALDKATAAGKITPASRNDYRSMCSAEGGLERFNKLVETLPVIVEPSNLDGKQASTAVEEPDIDPVALAAAARKYQEEQAAVGRSISVSEAVNICKAKK